MSDDNRMSPSQEAEHAKRLLSDPLLAQIFNELEDACTEVWKRSTSPGQREDQWHMVTALGAVKASLQRRIEDMKIAHRSAAAARRSS